MFKAVVADDLPYGLAPVVPALFTVIPAEAGIQGKTKDRGMVEERAQAADRHWTFPWIPACAGMTRKEADTTKLVGQVVFDPPH